MTWDGEWLDRVPEEKRPRKSSSTNYQEVADDLRRNPWRWKIIRSSAPRSMITHLRNGKYRAFIPVSDFEFKIVGKGNRVVLFGHYVAAPKPEDYEEWPKP